MGSHLRVHNCANDGQFPMRVKELLAEFSCESLESIIGCEKLFFLIQLSIFMSSKDIRTLQTFSSFEILHLWK